MAILLVAANFPDRVMADVRQGHSDLIVHTLVLKCQDDAGNIFKSRLAALTDDVGDRKYDYGLTTAHSVFALKNCLVSDSQGHRSKVVSYQVSPDYPSNDPYNAPADWAVVKFKRIRTKGLVRFDLSNDSLDRESITTAYLPKGRGLFVNIKPCRVHFREARMPPKGEPFNVPTHDCRTINGQSGTPLVTQPDVNSDLLGIHSGRSFMWPNDFRKGPKWHGRFVLLDGQTIDEIDAALDALSTD